MKKNLTVLGILMLVILFALASFTGCAKKPVVVEEVTGVEEAGASAAGETAGAVEEGAVLEETAVGEAALSEKERLLQEASAFEDIGFDFDKYDLQPEARKILRGHADWLLQHTDFEAIIEGHCDERGTREYNLALGERRAEAARDYLINLGVGATRLTTVSYGEELPLDPGHTDDAWQKNRRGHFVIVAK
jgi:peptidoglycan-associated lipoprotein